uniref:TLC domain-containing protein n=1 Tax=Alexandrium catenella TaxID=2925 RepID=A0A7S1SB96_ALECA
MVTTKDLVIRPLVFIAVCWSLWIGLDLHKEVRARQLRQPGSYPLYSDLMPALWIFVGMTFAQLVFRQIFSVVARAMIPKKPRWSGPVWDAKVVRCCDAVFKCFYYLAITTWWTVALRGDPWVPRVLGGGGQTRSCWTDGHPFQPVPDQLRRFYLTAIGFHLSEAAMVFLETRKPDFWEMLLHHTIACSLVSYSYMLNYVRVGSLVLMLHGATDVFIYASKAVVDTPFIRVIAASYFGLIVAYAWFRIYIFPVYIMRSAWVESVKMVGSKAMFGWGFMNFALCVLLVLHIYWFGLIIKIGFVFRRTGQARDLQSNLSAYELPGKKKDQ